MTSKYAWCGVLIIAFGVAVATPAEAQFINGQIGPSAGPIVAGIVGTAAAVVVVTVLVIHYSKKRAITGCVVSAQSGMTLIDEKDKQTYMLSGDTTGIKAGDRMKLKGKKVKPKDPDRTLVWEARQVSKNYGACSP
ncbi:MAG: hypothetical protein WBE44_10645 [Terriglobales bacterium]|jgi:hypothetical protein